MDTKVSIWNYMHELRIKGVYKNKQRKFLSHIAIYVHDLRVYKVIVFPNTARKNGHRYGVNGIAIHTKSNNPRKITFPQLLKEVDNSDKGNMIFIYDCAKDDVNVYSGEDAMIC